MNQHLLLASERVVERHGAGLQLRAHHPLRLYRPAEERYREPERLVLLYVLIHRPTEKRRRKTPWLALLLIIFSFNSLDIVLDAVSKVS